MLNTPISPLAEAMTATLALKALLLLSCISHCSAQNATCPTDIEKGMCIQTKAYKYTNASTPAECCAACAAEHPKCIVWVLVKTSKEKGEGGNCRLKDQDTKSTPSTSQECLFSGRYPPAPPTPAAPTPPPPPTLPPSPAPRPHIIAILQDDLGHYDVAFNGNEKNEDVSGNISSLAQSGVIFDRHYVHWHCSPTRRTFLTGRLPLHHSELLSGIDSDDIDLRWKTIAQKLKSVGYKNYWFGKGHTGYKSVQHLPTHLGFDNFTGFLSGAQSYTASDRWHDELPLDDNTYSADLYGRQALATVQAHDPSVPLFLYLPWQNVHAPYQAPPGWTGDVLRGMLHAADVWVGRLVGALKQKQMYEHTVVFYSADNGGVDKGLNWPMRGEKHTNWEGGMRVAAFVSGGFLPAAVRGTHNPVVFHIADWYPTICGLAGVDGRDDPAVLPLPANLSHPSAQLYPAGAFPPVDGKDIWQHIVNTTYSRPKLTDHLTSAYAQGQGLLSAREQAQAVHEMLWLSAEVLLMGDMKLLVAQPDPKKMSAGSLNNGWKQVNETWRVPTTAECACGCAYKDRTHFVPCLFDVGSDILESKNLAAQEPDLLKKLWTELNRTNLELYGLDHSPPGLLGKCDAACAKKKWGKTGPVCGVPGC